MNTQSDKLIFFNNKSLAINVLKHLNKQLPNEYQSTGVIQYYHSGMSEAYLQVVHSAFT
jgi:hypothetical protein